MRLSATTGTVSYTHLDVYKRQDYSESYDGEYDEYAQEDETEELEFVETDN